MTSLCSGSTTVSNPLIALVSVGTLVMLLAIYVARREARRFKAERDAAYREINSAMDVLEDKARHDQTPMRED